MIDDFGNFPWHDAELLRLSIDRSDAGNHDEVRIEMAWPDRTTNTIIFLDCYAAKIEMNFGIISSEQIREAWVEENNPDIDTIVEKWHKLGVDLGETKCFMLETASTASVIRIYARSFAVE